MLARVLEIWAVHNAQKAAIALLGPRVDSTRRLFGTIPKCVWLDPYIVGFITTLVTIVAQRQPLSLGHSGLALVQSHVWSRLSGQSDLLIGREIILLSMADEPDFRRGCRSAMQFMAGLPSQAVTAPARWPWLAPSLPIHPGSQDFDPWSDFFDRRIEIMLVDHHSSWSRVDC